MSNYRRAFIPGASYFFTVVTYQRQALFQHSHNVVLLRESFRYVIARRFFKLDAIVILPDHIHCIWTLPRGDADYSRRWQILKTHFTRSLNKKPVWQARYWEHCLRDEEDWARHMDYIHFNPVKHGYALAPRDWDKGSFRRFANAGYYDWDWGACEPASIQGLNFE